MCQVYIRRVDLRVINVHGAKSQILLVDMGFGRTNIFVSHHIDLLKHKVLEGPMHSFEELYKINKYHLKILKKDKFKVI